MTGSILVAAIVAAPPTLAATLAFLAARASDRTAARERASTVALSLDNLRTAVTRVESTVDRIDAGVIELRERVARLEGARAASPAARG